MITPPPISAFAEPIVWRQDRAPQFSATFNGEVLRGTVDSASAGVALGPVTADVWRVHVTPTDANQLAMLSRIAMGDCVELPSRAVTLTVQAVVLDDSGAWLNCTANERARA